MDLGLAVGLQLQIERLQTGEFALEKDNFCGLGCGVALKRVHMLLLPGVRCHDLCFRPIESDFAREPHLECGKRRLA